jgi:hypothetical protein
MLHALENADIRKLMYFHNKLCNEYKKFLKIHFHPMHGYSELAASRISVYPALQWTITVN